jgi:hypothetical protein
VPSSSLDSLIRDLRTFTDSKAVVRELRTEIRKPVPEIRKLIKARALATLPKGGGLNVWVSKVRITVQIQLKGRAAGVRLKGGRNSSGGRSDTKAIDSGKVRAPSWGHRGKGAWHNQSVDAGFFTKPTVATGPWRDSCIRAADKALNVIRRGR